MSAPSSSIAIPVAPSGLMAGLFKKRIELDADGVYRTYVDLDLRGGKLLNTTLDAPGAAASEPYLLLQRSILNPRIGASANNAIFDEVTFVDTNTAAHNILIGASAGEPTGTTGNETFFTGSDNVMIGNNAGNLTGLDGSGSYVDQDASGCIYIGSGAGSNVLGRNNIILESGTEPLGNILKTLNSGLRLGSRDRPLLAGGLATTPWCDVAGIASISRPAGESGNFTKHTDGSTQDYLVAPILQVRDLDPDTRITSPLINLNRVTTGTSFHWNLDVTKTGSFQVRKAATAILSMPQTGPADVSITGALAVSLQSPLPGQAALDINMPTDPSGNRLLTFSESTGVNWAFVNSMPSGGTRSLDLWRYDNGSSVNAPLSINNSTGRVTIREGLDVNVYNSRGLSIGNATLPNPTLGGFVWNNPPSVENTTLFSLGSVVGLTNQVVDININTASGTNFHVINLNFSNPAWSMSTNLTLTIDDVILDTTRRNGAGVYGLEAGFFKKRICVYYKGPTLGTTTRTWSIRFSLPAVNNYTTVSPYPILTAPIVDSFTTNTPTWYAEIEVYILPSLQRRAKVVLLDQIPA